MSTASIGIASGLVNSCLAHLSKIPRVKRKKGDYQDRLDRVFGRFRLWADEFHDFPAPPSNGHDIAIDPLDEALEHSKYLKEPTVFLLSSFASCLLMKHFKTIGDSTTRALVENSLQDAITVYPFIPDSILCSDRGEGSAVEEFHHIVGSLFELSSPLSDMLESLRSTTIEPSPLPVTVAYRNYIYDKFPEAGAHIVFRFAEGNIECSKRLRAQAEQKQNLVSKKTQPTLVKAEQVPSAPITAQIDINQNVTDLSEIASFVQPASFHDSGLGSSHPPEPSNISSYVENIPPHALVAVAPSPPIKYLAPPPSVSGFSESTMCSVGSVVEMRSPIPAIPKNSKARIGFNCSICNRHLEPIFKNRQWRKHVFSDLQPYMCIREDCADTEICFQTRKEWIAHHNSHNTQNPTAHDIMLGTETCPFCLKEFNSNKGRFYSHVGHHMEDIRLFALPPSYRDSGELDTFENSSNTSSLAARAELAIITEDTSPRTPASDVFSKQLEAYNIIDKDTLLGDWLSSRDIADEQTGIGIGSLQDLEESMRASEEALEATPADHAVRAKSLYGVSTVPSSSYDRDIKLGGESFEATDANHLDRAKSLYGVSKILSSRYSRLGDLQDLEWSIKLGREALEATPTDNQNRAKYLYGMAALVKSRYNDLRDSEDLDQAIKLAGEALETTPADHPDRANYLYGMAALVNSRYNDLRDSEDLDQAIKLVGEALEATPADHPDRANYLYGMAALVNSRYDRLGDQDDLDWAINLGREGFEAIPANYLDGTRDLYGMSVAFSSKHSLFGDLQDFERAINLGGEGLEVSPEDDPDRAKNLYGVSTILSSRYSRLGNLQDLEWAIKLGEEALALVAIDHPERARYLENITQCVTLREAWEM